MTSSSVTEVGRSKVVLRGRSEVMTAALGVVRRVRGHGHGGVILIEGEPEIGKSAVFAEIVTQAARMTFTCAVGKADQIGRMSPAAPLLLALRSGAHPLVSATDLADLVARTTEPLLLLDDLSGLLERLSQDTPLLIGIDDAQWADPVTRFTLRALPSRLSGCAILWLFASRSSEHGLVEDLKDATFVQAVGLRHGTDGWMSSILARLPMTASEAGSVETERYLSCLSDALMDGRIVGEEAHALARLAGSAGLGSTQVAALNQRFLESMREAAFEDAILTDAELKSLRAAAKALGVPGYFDDLVVSSPTRSTGNATASVSRQRRCGFCREPGHYRSTCPQLSADRPEPTARVGTFPG